MGASKIKQRNMRFGQAVLLGVKITRQSRGNGEYSPWMYFMTIPDHVWDANHRGGYVSGPFKYRHLAVEAALKIMGV